MALENFKAPALPIPQAEYRKEYFDRLNNVLRLYFNLIDSDAAHRAYTYRTNGIIFNADGLPSPSEGQLSWNATDGTLNLGMEYGVTQQIGQETYARVQNDTGVLIPNGTVVGFVGVGPDQTLSVAPYLADGSQPSLYILGVMTHDLPDNGNKGLCTVWGNVRDLDTSAFSVGDVLYASPTVAGGFTNVKPTAPDNVVPVAAVLVADATAGEIFVRPTVQQMQYYGEFSATVNQTVAASNTAYAASFNSTEITNGVAIGTPASRLVVPESGLYRVQMGGQLTSTSSSAKTFWCWFRKNGVDIPNSARLLTSDINNGYAAISHDMTISMDANDYVELMYAADSTDIYFNAAAATAFAPAAAAVQISVTQVQL